FLFPSILLHEAVFLETPGYSKIIASGMIYFHDGYCFSLYNSQWQRNKIRKAQFTIRK
uniref:Transposase n=1 Tax=Parascaris univalens TaxID=6257 RepID=A0A915CFW4_PARUN